MLSHSEAITYSLSHILSLGSGTVLHVPLLLQECDTTKKLSHILSLAYKTGSATVKRTVVGESGVSAVATIGTNEHIIHHSRQHSRI